MRNIKKIIYLIFALALTMQATNAQTLDIQGHRGSRGLLPENTIPAFKKAVDLGVTTLELDVVITKDKKVVVSHDPYMSAHICTDASGNLISLDKENHNIFQMDYDKVKTYDCGSIGNERFPQQKKMAAYKPLLSEMITEIEAYIKEKSLPQVKYNIEIKSTKKGDNIFHPEVEEFTDLVYEVIKGQLPLERVIIQSFDPRVLQYLNKKDDKVTLAYLIERKKNFKKQIKKLGFTPDIYSPYYKLIDATVILKIHDAGMKVIPWTINEQSEMQLMIDWGVDGIITDYPDRAVDLK